MNGKMVKKLLAMLLAVGMVGLLAACGAKDPSNTPSTNVEYTAEKPLVIKVAHDEIIDSAQHRGIVAMKDYLEKESANRIKVEVYPNGELGGTAEFADMIALGSLHMACMATDILSSYNSKLSFLCLPFLFDDYDHAVELVYTPKSPFYNMYQEEANKSGYYVLGFQYDGTRGFSNNVREVVTAQDMKGLKTRVMQTDISVATFTALGCNVTPLAFSEVYTALQQNVVDGQDNPPTLTLSSKLNEVQKYYSTLGHRISVSAFVTNEKWLMSLPDDLREMIMYAGEEFAAKQQRVETRQVEEADLKLIDQSGCKVTYLSDRSTFVEATKPVYDQFRKVYGDEFMDKVLKTVEKK